MRRLGLVVAGLVACFAGAVLCLLMASAKKREERARKLAVFLALILFAGCAPSPTGTQPEVAPTTMHWEETLPGHFTRPTVLRLHDDARGVTCWVHASGGISCLPDVPCGGSR